MNTTYIFDAERYPRQGEIIKDTRRMVNAKSCTQYIIIIIKKVS